MLEIEFTSYLKVVQTIFEHFNLTSKLKNHLIILKPNLVTAKPFPVTTSYFLVEAFLSLLKDLKVPEVIIAEGSGDFQLTTTEIFSRLNYTNLAKRFKIRLIDLNEAKLQKISFPKNKILNPAYLPEICFQGILISLPVLKAHSLAKFTGTLKNMLGIAPPKYYSQGRGIWKKAFFHSQLDLLIQELNQIRSPDFTILDASQGLKDYHLGGKLLTPPPNKILAGLDGLKIDRKGASLLGLNYKQIPYLQKNFPLGRRFLLKN